MGYCTGWQARDTVATPSLTLWCPFHCLKWQGGLDAFLFCFCFDMQPHSRSSSENTKVLLTLVRFLGP